ncbi:hypothetical protein LJC52_05225, partial [Bacteroidales bacterium OttesenSCG-928-A17]|nr:hypothetical protein [Bacteroidales bacterium OttesenSCG-928-A17]
MKKILFICTMVLLCSVGMNAQQRERGNRGDMEKRMKERTENYIKELKLDEKKAAKFRTIFEEAQVQMQKEMASARESG